MRQKNTRESISVRYSAAYPTGRELMLEHRYDAPEKLCFGGEPRRDAPVAKRSGSPTSEARSFAKQSRKRVRRA